jgi:hypothetical protein
MVTSFRSDWDMKRFPEDGWEFKCSNESPEQNVLLEKQSALATRFGAEEEIPVG